VSERPSYFEPIRRRASERWSQLEHDPELAAPWHQLFMQVQSPRHVLSELMQNADDAGATEASVHIQDGIFVFSHNGEDFTEDHFASLCRFGYSNKRSLHTIGFRGVGFKSTFSMGDEVRLITPTLSIAFLRHRFTEPVWVGHANHVPDRTEVRVVIKDQNRKREIEKNLHEWLRSPVSLLFFRHIRCLHIEDNEVRWVADGPGPIRDSEWVVLSTSRDARHLLLRSPACSFPAEALSEIRQERLLSPEDETTFPPCHIEIVLGMEGSLFVVLPTGIKTSLPFACNAPFIQDPARVRIRDPEVSPTNRWLLERAGEFAARAMLEWLRRSDLDVKQRSEAYALLPVHQLEDRSLEDSCAIVAQRAFAGAFRDESHLLAESGQLEKRQGCIALPSAILDIWPVDQATVLFDDQVRPPLCRHIAPNDRKKLTRWGSVDELGKSRVLEVLDSRNLPQPQTWPQLLALWAYVAPDVTSYLYAGKCKGIRIVPVRGKDELHAASESVRLGEKRLLESEEDWEFLANYLLVMDQNWPRFLADQRRTAEERQDSGLGERVQAAYMVLKTLGLDDASDAGMMIKQVAEAFFALEAPTLELCVRLAQIAAALGPSVGQEFRFATRDRRLRTTNHQVVFDSAGDIEAFVAGNWAQSHVLHEVYSREFRSCTKSEWDQWVKSGRSGLLTFIPLVQVRTRVWGLTNLRQLLQARGFRGDPVLTFRTHQFVIEDWDFDESHWQHWSMVSKDEQGFWGRLVARVLGQQESYWEKTLSARALQVARTGNSRVVTSDPLLPAWIIRLRNLPCLRDTRGCYRLPPEMLRRTPQTEALLEVEPFVHGELDNEANRQLLVKLGVRDTPTGPGRILDRLRALAKTDTPPIHEVEKWYRQLDKMLFTCSTDEFNAVKRAFTHERIVLTQGHGWTHGSEVFLCDDEEVAPGVAIVMKSAQDLTIWRKVGVADRPTADLAIQWLKSLQSGKALSHNENRRVRSLLSRYPEHIWTECGHWLNLEGEWAPIGSLVYSLTMQSLVPWGNLFPWVKRKTADFQHLSSETCERPPFSELPRLSSRIEDRFPDRHRLPRTAQWKPWLVHLGTELRRIALNHPSETSRVRDLAVRLATTVWQQTSGLETIPYIDSTPAGMPRRIEVLWKDSVLYVEDRPMAKLAKAVAHELGRVFQSSDIADALKLCFDRSPEFITEYLSENFRLIAPEELPQTDTHGPRRDDGSFGKAIVRLDEPLLPAGQQGVTQESAGAGAYPFASEGAEAAGEHQGQKSDENAGAEDGGAGTGGEGQAPPHRREPPKAPKPILIERFARSLGYTKDGVECFLHADGSWISRSTGSAFPWERRSASGELLHYYWPKDHCIQLEPLQLDAGVWAILDKYPDLYSLILTEPDGAPVEIPGHRLREMCDAGELTLYPAAYRLVYGHARDG